MITDAKEPLTISVEKLRLIAENPPARVAFLSDGRILAVPFGTYSSMQSRSAKERITVPKVIEAMEADGFEIPSWWLIKKGDIKGASKALTEYKMAHILLANMRRLRLEAV